ncbi:protein KINESIN LIGHT CHAIN-RELATED 2-like [Chenopodium quinoa]|uniref:Kinesin light chain n=1 Tax=Chenopodium quinoa TaxID=63459 RepID=A0A803LFD1_CHEQI|nr:protein KINESIN LIGHT CHAIN-RELATED 2-like [Chenopodium quinoa]
MRRASIKLLSFSKPRSISRNLTTQICSTLVSTDQSCTQLNSCSNSKGLLFFTPKTHQFQKTPSQNFNTQVEIHSKLPSRQRKIKERSQIENDFEAAKTAEDMLEAFKEMEANFDEKDLGLACLKIGLKLDQEGEDPEKVLPYAIRALAVFDSENQISLPIAMTLQLLGSTSYCLNKFNDALGYLNRANKILGRLEEEGSFRAEDLKSILHAVQLELANTKTAMGRREEALGNLRHSVEIKEFLMGEDRKEVGNAYRDLAEACVAILNFKEGLPYCLKALELHIKLLGENSVEVAHDRRLLGVIHTGMEEYEKALEQNQLSQKVLKNWGRSSDLLRAEIDAANMHIALGRFEAAINTLKGVVQQTEKDSEHRALIFITMAKALVSQEKFADAKRCLEIASGILDKKEKLKPLDVSEAYMEISMQYETMNEFETAVSLLKRAHALLEKLPQEQHSEGSVSARIGWLLLLTGKVTQAIPYLESAAETLKESFGPKHFGVGYIYNNLGAAYLELERPQSAAQMFAVAKEIMDVSLGPHHVDSIEACQNLSKAYASMESYALAIEFQQKAVDAWGGHGKNAEDELREACRILEQLKIKALGGFSSKVLPTKALPLPQNSNPTRIERR